LNRKTKTSIITLTTDFGLKDPWAAEMKGVILSINPSARIVDVTHLVSPQNIVEGAFVLSRSFPFFPAGTIHVAVVDPGVGTARAPILVETEDFYLVGPDNGIFTLTLDALEEEKIKRVIKLTREEFFLKEVSATFHGRDIFAPVAAHLSLGADPESFGEPLGAPPRRLKISRPEKSENTLTGEVIYIDNFGNLITNIDSGDVSALRETGPLEVVIKGVRIEGISETYLTGEIKQGAHGPPPPVAVIGSTDFLEIACYMAKASDVTGAGVGERVDVRVIKR
jgi:S-adenosylmethionine hydrolase